MVEIIQAGNLVPKAFPRVPSIVMNGPGQLLPWQRETLSVLNQLLGGGDNLQRTAAAQVAMLLLRH